MRSFASTVRDRPRARTCACTYVRVLALTYVYIYTQLGPGLVPDPAVPPRRAGSSPITSSVPAPIGVPTARLRHRWGCMRLAHSPTGRDQLDPPLRESSRQINELRIVRPFVCANCVRVYRYTIERAYAHAYTCICACSCIRVSLRLFTCINANAVSYVRLCACLRAELIKTQNALHAKYFNTQTHFGFRNFQDVLYIYNIFQSVQTYTNADVVWNFAWLEFLVYPPN